MRLSDDEAKSLKTWIIKRLEDISDADSDVLADYVLALIRAETPDPELKANAVENLEDFLHDHTARFVDEIFDAVHAGAYLPSYKGAPALPKPASTGTAAARANGFAGQNRKRSYNDAHGGPGGAGDGPHGHDGRQLKHTRRGGSGGGHGPRGGFAGRGATMPGVQPPALPGLPLPGPSGNPLLPDLPMNPEALAAFIAMQQALGIPPPEVPAAPAAPGRPPSSGGKTRIDARCRDYDTKGICLRGVACPFNHGDTPVVKSEEYDPNNAGLDFAAAASPTGGAPVASNGHLETFRGQAARGRGRGRGDYTRGSGGGGGGLGNRGRRAEFSMPGPNHDRALTSLVVEQIPEENFEEAQVRDFFGRFGAIEEVSMRAYKRLAIVRFGEWTAARAAYESPEVIFGNRFVKVYWYNPERMGGPSSANGAAVADAGSIGSPTTPSMTTVKPEEPAFDREKFEREAEAAQKKLEERRAQQKAHEEKKAALERQRAELEEKQAAEKRKLLEKLRAKGAAPADSTETQNGVEGTNGSYKPKASATTEALRAKVKELEAEAKSMGLDPDQLGASSPPGGFYPGRGRGRGRGGFRGGFDPSRGAGGYRGRGGYRGGRGASGGLGYNLDNRPRTVRVVVEAPDDAKDEALRQFLFSVGEPASITASDDGAATTVAFRDRFTAEKLFFGPRDIPGVGPVDMAWMPNAAAPALPALATNGAAAAGATGAAAASSGFASPVTPSTAGLPPFAKPRKDDDAVMGGVAGLQGPASAGVGADEARDRGSDVADDDEDVWVQ